MNNEAWPALPLAEWKDTYDTLHMWSQIVGKIVLAGTPVINHWWNVSLHVTARGLATPAISYDGRTLAMELDLIDHWLRISTSNGDTRMIPLESRSVAEFYAVTRHALTDLGIGLKIWPVPVEVPDPIPFKNDTVHASYDPEYTLRFLRAIQQIDRVFNEFRSRFVGKCSPVHFFWGGFDLAVTRFSGRPAPERPDADLIQREGYSHEVISHGFWPGSGGIDEPMLYAYAAPEPAGFREAVVRPDAAAYNGDMGEFFLPYEAVRTSSSPDAMILEFMQSTYDAAADLAKWDRDSLERRGG